MAKKSLLILLIVVVLAVIPQVFPPQTFLQPSYIVQSRAVSPDGYLRPTLPGIIHSNELENEGLSVWRYGEFPLVISPLSGHEWSAEKLVKWVAEHKDWIKMKFNQHGAILFRDFPITTSGEFEALSLELTPKLDEEFLRSTPRSRFNDSKVVYTASDDASWVVIPAHCERCWIPNPPRVILFYAQVPNNGSGGETPLVDYREVWRSMKPELQQKFREKKLQYVRHFYDVNMSYLDMLKSFSWPVPTHWQQMFDSNDPLIVEEHAKKLGFSVEWLDSTPGHGIIEARSIMPAFTIHPETGDEVWHNHLNILHVSAHEAEYAFSTQHMSSWFYLILHYFTRFQLFAHSLMFGDNYIGQTTLYGDGSEIPFEDLHHVRMLVWNNTVIYKHQPGDVVFVDNYRLAHARQPFSGFRRILTTWA